MKRSMYSLKVAKVMDAKSMEKNQEMIDDLQRRIERLEVNSRHSVEELHKGVAFEVDSLYRNITTLLRDREFVQKLVTWEAKDCPRPDDWKKTAREASERIASRIALEVNLWERNNNVNANIKEKIVKKFKRDFELMEDQIKAIEGALLAGETRVITDLHKSMKKQLPVKQLFKKAKHNDDSDSVKGLGGTVSSAGGFNVGDKQIKRLFNGYKKDTAEQKMIEATEIFISDILSGQYLREKLEKYLGRFVKGIDNVVKMIPEFLKADKQLIKTLQQQMRSAEDNLKDVYPELIHLCQTLQGQLDLFFVYRILEMDYRLRDLDWKKEDLIGTGSFAEVFKAKLHKGRDVIPVALKVCRDSLKESTVTDILLEDRTLRELEHENIVRYYGSTCKQDGKGGSVKVTWIMI
ncbi:hypothetical protein KUTeg_020047 [Tegillarca granosa]|uniref:Protein kinase domain-containing protein n=1 Tax=Tegillarca granosa TaxID=220873 RepID=A0ABQ9EC28_TEGGR|nr:hypothetical protein KUTeg_020047 [Tegillarca granosa]